MANVETALLALLAQDADLTSLVGSRVWAQLLPESPTLPAIVFNRVGVERDMTLGGQSTLAKSRWAFVVYGEEKAGFAVVRQIAARLRGIFAGFRGMIGGVRLLETNVINEEETPLGDGAAYFYRVGLEILVVYEEI